MNILFNPNYFVIGFKTTLQIEPALVLSSNFEKLLTAETDKDTNRLIVRLWTDGKDKCFTLLGPEDTMIEDFIVAYNGVNFYLFADGELYDEEWPFGSFQFNNEFVLQGNEITVFDKWIIPQVKENKCNMQYFCPPGYNTSAGDCMPYYHDGIFHLYYLYDRRHHGSKHGFGAHQWAHASTKDMIHWEHHPIALGVTDKTEGSICTGSVIERNGRFYAFYAKRDTVDRCEKITYAVGNSPNYFEKTNKILYEFPSPPYVKGPGRDPYVFLGEDGLYHMMITSKLEDDVNGNKGGCLAMLVSENLEEWSLDTPYLPGYNDDPECSEYFKMNDWYYLVFSNEGVAKYRMSKTPFGPWIKPDVDVFDAACYRVMKSAPFKDKNGKLNRRVGAAFLEKTFGHFGGNIIFREIFQRDNGTLGTKSVPELELAKLKSIVPEFKSEKSDRCMDQDILIDALTDFTSCNSLSSMPRNFKISIKVKPEKGTGYFGIAFRCSNKYSTGHELRFDMLNKTAEVKKSSNGYWHDNNKNKIYGLELNSEFTLTITVYDSIVDACINNERTICSRIENNTEQNGLILYAHNMTVVFRDIAAEEV